MQFCLTQLVDIQDNVNYLKTILSNESWYNDNNSTLVELAYDSNILKTAHHAAFPLKKSRRKKNRDFGTRGRKSIKQIPRTNTK